MKILKIVKNTSSTTHEVETVKELRYYLEQEYNWTHIYGVHTHYATLLDENENEIATLNLLEHDDFSGESLIEEDDGEISNLYNRLGNNYWSEDYGEAIHDFCSNI